MGSKQLYADMYRNLVPFTDQKKQSPRHSNPDSARGFFPTNKTKPHGRTSDFEYLID